VQLADTNLAESRHLPALSHATRKGGKEGCKPLRGEWALREAVLLAFCTPLPDECVRLRGLSQGQWRRLLLWLDYSGLALYFLDRINELQICDWLPAEALDGLRQRQIDNAERTRTLIEESIDLQKEFQQAGLRYAVLKGLSNWPVSTPRADLRSQFDLDFLIAEEDLDEGRRTMERRGYRLYSTTGMSWEFRRNERPGLSIKDIYKPMPSFLVELHTKDRRPGQRRLLDHTETRELFGMSMPVLSPADQFISQGLHAFKHVCTEFPRASHLLEFRRHVIARAKDAGFWSEVRDLAQCDPNAPMRLGAVILLISGVMGEFAPHELTHWTTDQIPREVALWIELYGKRTVLARFPGSKLYLLLQRELGRACPLPVRPIHRKIVPLYLPLPVVHAAPNETLRVRTSRYRMQLEVILTRAYFHIVQGARCYWELRRFRRQLALLRRRAA
jgi:hypothetical protein